MKDICVTPIIKSILFFLLMESLPACHSIKSRHYKNKYAPKKYIIYKDPSQNKNKTNTGIIAFCNIEI
jgi:hypothetical protein